MNFVTTCVFILNTPQNRALFLFKVIILHLSYKYNPFIKNISISASIAKKKRLASLPNGLNQFI
ncbi:hypothetical protein FC07_GL002476 [Loigolactobacillus bifermentans DSM 20003]|uniref:Uncharacterized protein n=1 Tax=Loigolactobacillus bifermentans DSM 20003 TaxID=1423726 RepID=A0A0R1H7A5_9LACO|nr:hypothetical protein FC07_GL002476 [Loigolactobacillus bifermentans DSM 20003]